MRDLDVPKNSAMSPGALDYASSGIIGSAFDGGMGAFELRLWHGGLRQFANREAEPTL
ncbi:hypothetical protein L2703_05010 [Shewanella basaltis]|uniref:hypothetical protein n=1 Tax=Shewanella TaxID=22 RepID=UPI00200C54D4|nr:hypothetical protein [Shewanella basaltis]MCL1112955.1 hypothetical protein [Shewanella basaltis]